MSQIEVKNLKVFYGSQAVLSNINLEISQGEFVSILGRSGCGKSTLLKALAGFIESEGQISIPDNVGVVFQSNAVFPWLTVRENIGFGLSGIKPIARDIIIKEYLELTELTQEANKYPAQLSGGQSQRVAFARSLAVNPEVFLMDEPFGALDNYTRNKMQAWLLNIWEKTCKTIVFVTHDVEEAIFLSDQIFVLREGTLITSLKPPFQRPRANSLKFDSKFTHFKQKIYQLIEDIN